MSLFGPSRPGPKFFSLDMSTMDSSNSSNVAPVGVGNTETPTARQGTCKTVWFITMNLSQSWNSSNSSNLNSWIKEHCKDATWQLERGAAGNLHVQLTMRLKVKQRLTWLKRHFSKIAHCEVSNNPEASYDYCCKTDSRVEGPYYYPEPVSDGVDDPLEGLQLYEWQQRIVDIITGPVDNRKVFWFWEPVGNVGKSDFCLHCILRHNAVVYDSGKKDILFAHKRQKVVFFDLSRTVEGFVSYDSIEQLKKGFCFSGKYESGMKVYPKPHIIVFANFPPDTSKLSADRWVIERIE